MLADDTGVDSEVGAYGVHLSKRDFVGGLLLWKFVEARCLRGEDKDTVRFVGKCREMWEDLYPVERVESDYPVIRGTLEF